MPEMKKILVTGSICYDSILSFDDKFTNHIISGEKISVSFTMPNASKSFGGTASNIAYSLALIGERPILISDVGEDFKEYKEHLEERGVDTSLVREHGGELTAFCNIMTDKEENQITGFHPGALTHQDKYILKGKDLSDVKIAIMAPGPKNSMMNFANEFRELKIAFVFDPGQQMPCFTGEELLSCMAGAKLTILNDYEYDMLKQKTGLRKEGLLDYSEMLIVTKGKDGSEIITKDETIKVPAVISEKAVDPTGAGDAYRAGLIKGMLLGLPQLICGKLGALTAVYACEKRGTQEHHYSLEEFKKRYEKYFGGSDHGL